MSHRIDLKTAEMIRAALTQQEALFRGEPEHAGLELALSLVTCFCAIPLAEAVIARAMDKNGQRVGPATPF